VQRVANSLGKRNESSFRHIEKKSGIPDKRGKGEQKGNGPHENHLIDWQDAGEIAKGNKSSVKYISKKSMVKRL